MRKLFHSRSLYITAAILVIGFVVALMFGVGKPAPIVYITTTVESGSVRQLVSVSGIAKAESSAALAFPVSGIVKSVSAKKGEVVESGSVLVELEHEALKADRQEALAAITQAVATRDELLAGPTDSARTVTSQTLENAQAALANTRALEEQKVASAYSTLLSSGLTAYASDPNEDAVAPVVSGSYNCTEEGSYVLDLFTSSSQSGYSYRLSGLETGTFSVSTDQTTALGSCGLRITFDKNSVYSQSQWVIEIPNTQSPLYVPNLNAYTLAQNQAQTAIDAAQQAVLLAEATATNTNAPARTEALRRAEATIVQAQARLARIDAEIENRILRAPFAGTVTELDILPGETVTTEPVITLLGGDSFTVTARIPEIDIGKLLDRQKVELLFDAKNEELLTGEIDFISLKSNEIDGVAYFEARIILDTNPIWMRSGLNADIDIIINETTDTLRVPRRFVKSTDEGFVVLQQIAAGVATTTIDIVLEGNDGYVAITGLNAGDTLIAP